MQQINSVVVMEHRTYSTSDLSRKSGDIIADALRHPVTITQRNKPRLVILNAEDYALLRAQGDTRRAQRLDQMDDALFAEVKAAVDEYAGHPTPDGE